MRLRIGSEEPQNEDSIGTLGLRTLECGVVPCSACVGDVQHRVRVPVEYEVHQEAGYAAVAVREGVNCHELQMDKRGELDGMQAVRVA